MRKVMRSIPEWTSTDIDMCCRIIEECTADIRSMNIAKSFYTTYGDLIDAKGDCKGH